MIDVSCILLSFRIQQLTCLILSKSQCVVWQKSKMFREKQTRATGNWRSVVGLWDSLVQVDEVMCNNDNAKIVVF